MLNSVGTESGDPRKRDVLLTERCDVDTSVAVEYSVGNERTGSSVAGHFSAGAYIVWKSAFVLCAIVQSLGIDWLEITSTRWYGTVDGMDYGMVWCIHTDHCI